MTRRKWADVRDQAGLDPDKVAAAATRLELDLPTAQLTCFWCDQTWPCGVGITPAQVTAALDAHERQNHPETLGAPRT